MFSYSESWKGIHHNFQKKSYYRLHPCQGLQLCFTDTSKFSCKFNLYWIFDNSFTNSHSIKVLQTHIQILGQIGYNCLHGNCYLIPNEDNFNGLSPAFIIDVIGFSIPFTIILTSYGYILILVWKERNHLKRHRRQHYSQSSSLIYKFSWTIFLICFCFLAFVLPFNICDFLEETGVFSVDHSIRLAMLYLKWVHFAINFVIYAATSDQYRKAYLFFLKRVM